jgi:hypothetical protein
MLFRMSPMIDYYEEEVKEIFHGFIAPFDAPWNSSLGELSYKKLPGRQQQAALRAIRLFGLSKY